MGFTDASTDRGWEIKVTQLPCNHPNKQPEGCLQYHTATSGRFETFNWPATNNAADATGATSRGHLANQDYSVCIRQNEGFCCVQYQVCSDASTADAMSIFRPMGDDGAAALVDSSCDRDYIGIAGSSASCISGTGGGNLNNRYCGGAFNPVTSDPKKDQKNVSICDCTAPFTVDIKTDAKGDEGATAAAAAATAAPGSRGVCIEYTQIPCSG